MLEAESGEKRSKTRVNIKANTGKKREQRRKGENRKKNQRNERKK